MQIENTKKEFFLSKLRHGNYSLAKSFWLFGVLLSTIITVCYNLIITITVFSAHSATVHAHIGTEQIIVASIFLISSLFVIYYYISLYIGLWRAASQYKGFVLWKYLTYIYVCICVCINLLIIFAELSV